MGVEVKYLNFDDGYGGTLSYTIFRSTELLNYVVDNLASPQYVDLYNNLTLVGDGFNDIFPVENVKLIGAGAKRASANILKYTKDSLFTFTNSNIPFPPYNEDSSRTTTVLSCNDTDKITLTITHAWNSIPAAGVGSELKYNDTTISMFSSPGGYATYYYNEQEFTRYSGNFVIFSDDFTKYFTPTLDIMGSFEVTIVRYGYAPPWGADSSLAQEIWDLIPGEPSEDPFTPGGTTGGDDTETEGGTGDFDGEGDAIAEPELPSLSSTDSGFLSLFNPTLAQVQALGAFMWSENFVLDTFKKLFSDPMQAILGLSIVPVSPSATTTVSVVLGNVDTGVSMPLITNQYVHKELGTITLSEYWGAYLDYSPYTKVEIYLPYIGVKTLNTDDVMGKTLKLSYNIDLLTGACVALLVVGGSLLYQFTGACASSVPITANDWTNVINGVLSTAGKVAAVMMTGGLSSPRLPGTIASTAATVTSMKPTVEKSGTMQGMPGLLASDRPFLIVTRPRQALPARQNHYQGYPSFVTRTLGSVTGYTVVDDIHLEGMTCTDTEKEEIRRLLKEGVIL